VTAAVDPMAHPRPGDLLGFDDSTKATVVRYKRDGRWYAALFVESRLVKAHPRGGWGIFDPGDTFTRWLTKAELEAVRFLAQIDDPPLLPEQAGLIGVPMPAESPPEGDGDLQLFRRWTMAELLAEPDKLVWLLMGFLCELTYGQIAGELKSLKTYLAAMIQVGLAAGVPVLGRFRPPAPRPVLAYVGEGGRIPYIRRLKRVAEAMDVDLAHIPLEIVTDVAPITSEIFQASLARDLHDLQPALVTLDPYYAYHGVKTSASNLHEEGALLSGLSNRCLNAGASLLIVNHMNQTGNGMDLKRITMAGSGEWVDSWMLLAHRETPDLDAGNFKLKMQIGSRQWGGTTWDLDLGIGHFDQERGHHDGPIHWDLQPAATGAKTKPAADDTKVQDARAAILDLLTERPAELTKTQTRDGVAGARRAFEIAWDTLIEDNRISHNKAGRTEAGTTKSRIVWSATTNPDHTTSPGSPWENT
jgi:hypothetical protein